MTPDLTAAVDLLRTAQADVDAARDCEQKCHAALMDAKNDTASAVQVFAAAQEQFLAALRDAGAPVTLKLTG